MGINFKYYCYKQILSPLKKNPVCATGFIYSFYDERDKTKNNNFDTTLFNILICVQH